MKTIEEINLNNVKKILIEKKIPEFFSGDVVKVGVRITEGGLIDDLRFGSERSIAWRENQRGGPNRGSSIRAWEDSCWDYAYPTS